MVLDPGIRVYKLYGAIPGPIYCGPRDPQSKVDIQMLRLSCQQPPGVVGTQRSLGNTCVRSRSAPQAITKHIRPKDSLTAPELHNGEPHQDGGFNFGPCASWRSSVRSSAQPKADPTCSWERKQCFFHRGRHLGISPRISGGSGRKHLGLQ